MKIAGFLGGLGGCLSLLGNVYNFSQNLFSQNTATTVNTGTDGRESFSSDIAMFDT